MDKASEVEEIYRYKLGIAVDALEQISKIKGKSKAIAEEAIERMKQDADPIHELGRIEVKIIKVIKQDTLYEVKDHEYNVRWEILLKPLERGDMMNVLPVKVREKREAYDARKAK